jgi:hypothetical protein
MSRIQISPVFGDVGLGVNGGELEDFTLANKKNMKSHCSAPADVRNLNPK